MAFNFIFTFCVEIKCQLDATEVFIADIIAYSTCFGHNYAHHQELKSIIQWLLPVVFRAVQTVYLTHRPSYTLQKTYQEHPHTAPTTLDTPSKKPR